MATLLTETQKLSNLIPESELDLIKSLPQSIQDQVVPSPDLSKSAGTPIQLNLTQIQQLVPNESGVQSLSSKSIISGPFNFIIGTPNPDFLVGTNKNDLILGRGGNDIIIALGGNDLVFGEEGNDIVIAGSGNDFVSGGSGNDFVFGSSGNDILDGGSGNDSLFGGTGKNHFIGSSGNDVLDGEEGNDSVDYTGLGRAITLLPTGIVNKSGLGQDTLIRVETIIGDAGQANTIDASSAGTGASVNVNLQQNSLQINVVNGPVLNRTVQNFVNVKGAGRNDTIIGDNNSNQLTGGAGSDNITGGGGNDTIVGVDPNSKQPGINEIDILTGGAGADKFVMGDSKNPYYVGGGGFLGLNDYALLKDFQSGTDKIQLKSGLNYTFASNFIAVNQGFSSSDKSLASVEQIANDIAGGKSLGVESQLTIGDSSLDSVEKIAPNFGFDIIAIVSGGYNQGDLTFV
ncbi:calcium-binding protein [Moorena sp. SIO2C4]|uniref:calcium-binding protein n=1 Tax=Moorena sp. SIO2C4 TaxID=2607824 RepID=UPI0013CD4F00|nr:calcium-binding protein [Moorena sp. SIO2C4]NES44730.1 calcium-binding protein [Moorena sp. SIO2C4]